MSLNRQITLKGDFQRAVIINDSLINGESCYYDSSSQLYSHAEGYKSKAFGKYSHAEGVNAVVNSDHDYSYVRSCVNPDIGTVNSKGAGTYCVYTGGYDPTATATASARALDHIYLNGVQLKVIEDLYRDEAVRKIRTEDNVFTKSLYLSSGSGTRKVQFDSDIEFTNYGTTVFEKSVTLGDDASASTQTTSSNDTHVATCEFVHSVVQEYLKNIFGESIFNS